MHTVGIRELKSRLSAYIRLVRSGEIILVTDRGEVVAEMRRPDDPAAASPFPLLDRLVREGVMRQAAPHPPPDLYARQVGPRLADARVDELLDAARGDRCEAIPGLAMFSLDHRIRDNAAELGFTVLG